MSLKTKTFLALITIIIVSGLFFFIQVLINSKKYVPQEFIDARIKAAEIAETIVEFSTASLNRLGQINDLDKAKNYPEAIILISNEIIQNRKTREEAISLSSQLTKMTEAISKISPAKARQVATEAVSYEVSLVSELISYNDFFNQLFEILLKKFRQSANSIDGQVQQLINKINNETRAINEFNVKFNSKIGELEQILK